MYYNNETHFQNEYWIMMNRLLIIIFVIGYLIMLTVFFITMTERIYFLIFGIIGLVRE